MGNVNRTQGNLRSWPDVSVAATAQTHTGLQRGAQGLHVPKITKPIKLMAIISLKSDTLSLTQTDDNKISLSFDFETKSKGKIAIFLAQYAADISKKQPNFTQDFSEGLQSLTNFSFDFDSLSKINPMFTTDFKPNFYPLIIEIIRSETDSDSETQPYGEKQTSYFTFGKQDKKKQLIHIKQTITYMGVEYVYKKWFEDSAVTPEDNKCVICLENDKDVVINPCLHKCLCKTCANELRSQQAACPLCRTKIDELWVIKNNQRA